MNSNSKRKAILLAASAVVKNNGVEKLTLEAVAKEAGVSKGGLLHHFPNKEALIMGMVEELTNDFFTNVQERAMSATVEKGKWSRAFAEAIDEDLKEERARFKFTQSQFEEFRNFIGFDKFIRGHQVETEGYRKLFDDRFITIFSSGKILKDGRDINTDTAYTRVNPHIIKFIDDRIELIALND